MAREKKAHRFAVIDGGLGKKAKRPRKPAFVCPDCKSMLWSWANKQDNLPDGTLSPVRKHRFCLPCAVRTGAITLYP